MAYIDRSRIARLGARLLRTRWIVRTPVALYRARLGWLFGSRLLMLEHRGRLTGQPRYAVLEVVDTPSSGTWIVVAGFGRQAQWLLNIRADPHVRVWVGGHRPAVAIAMELTAAERGQALGAYSASHPRAWRELRPVLEETLGSPIDAEGTDLPMVALRSV